MEITTSPSIDDVLDRDHLALTLPLSGLSLDSETAYLERNASEYIKDESSPDDSYVDGTLIDLEDHDQ